MNKGFVIGLLVGAGIGAAIGLVLAPQQGMKTREQLAEKSKETAQRVGHAASTAISKLKDTEEGLKQAI